MKTVRWFLFVLTIFLYSACSECSCINNNLGVGINFINFDSTEVDTIIVKKYQKGTGFTKEIDSTIFQEGDYRLKEKETHYLFLRTSVNFPFYLNLIIKFFFKREGKLI